MKPIAPAPLDVWMADLAELYGPSRAADFEHESPIVRAYLEHLQKALAANYQMVRPRKVGGSGIVFEVVRIARREAAVLKFNRPNAWPGEEPLVAREAKRLAAVNHAHIISVLDAGGFHTLSPNLWYLVEPFAKGPLTVDEYLRKRLGSLEVIGGGLPTSRAALQETLEELQGLVDQWADALSYLHGLGLVLLDIKPENATVDSNGLLLVIDLGSAEHLDETDERPLHVHVTRRYAHPDLLRQMRLTRPSNRKELIVKRNELRVELDYYALGKSTLELLAEVARVGRGDALPLAAFQALQWGGERLLDGQDLAEVAAGMRALNGGRAGA